MIRFLTFLILIAAIVIGVAGYVGWIREFNATVQVNGAPVPARVYKSFQGEVLVDLGRTPGIDYVVRGASVGRPTHFSFFKYDYVVFSKQFPLLTVDMRYEKSRACDPHLSVDGGRIRFLDCGKAVQVNLH